MKLFVGLVVIACLVGAGYFIHDWLTTTRNERICERLKDHCGSRIDEDDCEEGLDELEDTLGSAVLDRADKCVGKAKSCFEANVCILQIGADAMKDLMDDLDRTLKGR
jgi:hypothetical protein